MFSLLYNYSTYVAGLKIDKTCFYSQLANYWGSGWVYFVLPCTTSTTVEELCDEQVISNC